MRCWRRTVGLLATALLAPRRCAAGLSLVGADARVVAFEQAAPVSVLFGPQIFAGRNLTFAYLDEAPLDRLCGLAPLDVDARRLALRAIVDVDALLFVEYGQPTCHGELGPLRSLEVFQFWCDLQVLIIEPSAPPMRFPGIESLSRYFDDAGSRLHACNWFEVNAAPTAAAQPLLQDVLGAVSNTYTLDLDVEENRTAKVYGAPLFQAFFRGFIPALYLLDAGLATFFLAMRVKQRKLKFVHLIGLSTVICSMVFLAVVAIFGSHSTSSTLPVQVIWFSFGEGFGTSISLDWLMGAVLLGSLERKVSTGKRAIKRRRRLMTLLGSLLIVLDIFVMASVSFIRSNLLYVFGNFVWPFILLALQVGILVTLVRSSARYRKVLRDNATELPSETATARLFLALERSLHFWVRVSCTGSGLNLVMLLWFSTGHPYKTPEGFGLWMALLKLGKFVNVLGQVMSMRPAPRDPKLAYGRTVAPLPVGTTLKLLETAK